MNQMGGCPTEFARQLLFEAARLADASTLGEGQRDEGKGRGKGARKGRKGKGKR